MRVLYLSDFWTFIMCVIVWFVLQAGATLLCLYLPDHFFSPDLFIFRTHKFEQEMLLLLTYLVLLFKDITDQELIKS